MPFMEYACQYPIVNKQKAPRHKCNIGRGFKPKRVKK